MLTFGLTSTSTRREQKMSLAAALGMQSIKRPDGTHSYPCRARVNKEVRETPEDGEGNELSSRLRP